MASRANLKIELEKLIDGVTVYFNAPEKTDMKYPAIKCSIYKIDTIHANNLVYRSKICYGLTVIGKLPNDSIIDKLLTLPMCSYDRHYTSDGLNHDVLRLYY